MNSESFDSIGGKLARVARTYAQAQAHFEHFCEQTAQFADSDGRMSTDLSRLIASHYMAPDDGDQANRAKQNAARTGHVGGAETAGAAARLWATAAEKRDHLK